MTQQNIAAAEFDAFVSEYAVRIAALGGTITAREVRRRFWRFRRTNGACLLDCLADTGLGEWIYRPPGPKGGRPSKVFKLHGAAVATVSGSVNPVTNNLKQGGEHE